MPDKSLTRRRFHALAAATAVSAALPARAQSYPTRPIRVIVPFPPGNAGDITARLIGDEVGKRLGQNVIVDNRAGAAGAIGVQAVIGAAADGYTLLVTSLAPLSVGPALNPSIGYDPVRDLTPIALIGWTGMMLVAAPAFPANDVQSLVRLLRENPGRHTIAHIGTGTLSHMTQELFRLSTGVQFEGVPYRGSGQALIDLQSNRVDLMFDGMTSANPQAQAGRVKALAVSSPRRSVFAPNVPTLAESGVPTLEGFDVLGWTAILGPRGLPPAIVAQVNAAVNGAMADQGLVQRFAAQNLEVFPPSDAASFATFLAADLEKWRRVVREAKIEMPT